MRRPLAIVLLLMACGASAAEVAGVQLADKTQVESRDLVLNGAGLRKRIFFNVYVIGLYLSEKKSDANSIMALSGPKRAAIHMLRDVGAEQFSEALIDGVRANHSEAEFKALEARVKELSDIMAEIKEAKKGMTIALDWTGSVTRLSIDGRLLGKSIDGEDFYRALLRIWLGDKPVQEDLKRSLLGV
jgi:Chalcone isomerase-like